LFSLSIGAVVVVEVGRKIAEPARRGQRLEVELAARIEFLSDGDAERAIDRPANVAPRIVVVGERTDRALFGIEPLFGAQLAEIVEFESPCSASISSLL
jgi:hypothetical protein